MPYKTGKLKGQLTTAEIRKLVKAHNKLTDIVIPPKSSRDDIIKIVNKAGYNIDHEKQLLKPRVEMQRKKTISLKKAETITKPKPKTELQKQKMAEKKAEKEEQEKKKVRAIKKEAIQEEKKRQKPVKKVEKKSVEKKLLKDKKSNINKDTMTDTVFIKRQKALQSQKQKEVKRALLKSKAPVDKSTRRGKKVVKKSEPVKKERTEAEKKYDVIDDFKNLYKPSVKKTIDPEDNKKMNKWAKDNKLRLFKSKNPLSVKIANKGDSRKGFTDSYGSYTDEQLQNIVAWIKENAKDYGFNEVQMYRNAAVVGLSSGSRGMNMYDLIWRVDDEKFRNKEQLKID